MAPCQLFNSIVFSSVASCTKCDVVFHPEKESIEETRSSSEDGLGCVAYDGQQIKQLFLVALPSCENLSLRTDRSSVVDDAKNGLRGCLHREW